MNRNPLKSLVAGAGFESDFTKLATNRKFSENLEPQHFGAALSIPLLLYFTLHCSV